MTVTTRDVGLGATNVRRLLRLQTLPEAANLRAVRWVRRHRGFKNSTERPRLGAMEVQTRSIRASLGPPSPRQFTRAFQEAHVHCPGTGSGTSRSMQALYRKFLCWVLELSLRCPDEQIVGLVLPCPKLSVRTRRMWCNDGQNDRALRSLRARGGSGSIGYVALEALLPAIRSFDSRRAAPRGRRSTPKQRPVIKENSPATRA